MNVHLHVRPNLKCASSEALVRLSVAQTHLGFSAHIYVCDNYQNVFLLHLFWFDADYVFPFSHFYIVVAFFFFFFFFFFFAFQVFGGGDFLLRLFYCFFHYYFYCKILNKNLIN